jgi:hypothetical protein
MKRFIVKQTGFVQIEACRNFLVEVPDHISEERAQVLLENGEVELPDDDGMGWWDAPDRQWVGCDVNIEETDVYDPDGVVGGPSTEGLRVIKFEGLEGATQ